MILQMKKVLLDPHLPLVVLLRKLGVFILKLDQVADRNEVHGSNICICGSLMHSNRKGFKFSTKLLRELALSILIASVYEYNIHSFDPKDGVLLVTKITNSWIQQFMDSQNIILLSQRVRLVCSPSKELHMKMQIAYHMGALHREFLLGNFQEHLMETLDETHFVVNLDNGMTLGFRGDTTIKYADVVSEGESMTLVVRISGGDIVPP